MLELYGSLTNVCFLHQFRFLKKLLLVHGHWSYARNGVMYVVILSTSVGSNSLT